MAQGFMEDEIDTHQFQFQSQSQSRSRDPPPESQIYATIEPVNMPDNMSASLLSVLSANVYGMDSDQNCNWPCKFVRKYAGAQPRT